MGKFLGVEFAPLNIPFERRLQTLAVLHYVSVFLFLPVFCLFLSIYLLFTPYWWLMAFYGIWFIYDFDITRKGGRRAHWFRRSPIWRHFRDYFPISLVKTAELDPSRNYIFGCHPHGVLSMGAFCNFATDATDFSSVFPGLTSHLATLVGQFWFPFRREYTMMTGACEVSRESISFVLRRWPVGHAVVVIIGGAIEALDAQPGSLALTLNKRRGFIRLALQEGASLVPVFSFGENDLYLQLTNPQGSLLRRFQKWFKDHMGFSPPVLHGRGIFNYNYGILPFRKPIHTVVGAPIPVDKVSHPTESQISDLHGKYVAGLVALFEENKTKYGLPLDHHLEIH